MALIPVVTSDQYILRVATDTMLYVLLAAGLNVAVGWAGLLDLSYIAFYGFAAYLFAELSSPHYGLHWATWATVPIVIVGTIVLGFLFSLPSRRVSGDYLAIVTLFFGQMFVTFTIQGYKWDWLGFGVAHDITGGPTGLTQIDPWRLFGHQLTDVRDYLWVALGGFVIVALALTFANRSRTGRAWRALRDDPLAAEVMGMPVNRMMLLAVAVGAGVAGLAGAINGAYYQGVFPSSFGFPVLITVYAMVILGGAGSLPGVVAGAILINVLLEVLRTPDHARWVFYVVIIGRSRGEGPALAGARRRAGRARRVRPRRQCDRRSGLAPRHRRADLHGRVRLHQARLARGGAPALARPPQRHVRGRELPGRQLRVRDPDRPRAGTHSRSRLVEVRLARADDLDGVVRLGDPADRGGADDAAAHPRGDPDRADGDAAAGPVRHTAGGDRLMAEPCSSSRNVSKSFGGLTVINELDLHVDEREIVSVIGPNGAGKTTLFNLVTGIYRPDEGEILLDGKNLVGLAPHTITKRGVARTFQTLRLFLNMSVKENVMAAAYGHTRASILESMLRLPRHRREEKKINALAEEKLAFFGQRLMGYRWNQPAYSLSYANRRRLEIARATATNPKILLLDEPAAGMNPVETHEITELIGELRDKGGYTILVIEHDMHVVEGISDRVVALDHGVKIAEGSFGEVATDPGVVEAYLGLSTTETK